MTLKGSYKEKVKHDYCPHNTIVHFLDVTIGPCHCRRLGDNPYICDCRALPFWNYYHTSFAVADSFIDFLSEMRCVQSYNVGQLIYEDYPACGKLLY